MPRLARLTVRLEGSASDVTLNIDGVAFPLEALGIERFTEPGSRRVVAERGAERAERTLVLVAGARQEVVLALPSSGPHAALPLSATAPAVATAPKSTPPPAPPAEAKPAPLRTLGWIGISAGGVGLVVGGVRGIVVGSRYSDLKGDCPSDSCSPEQTSSVNSYNSMRTISTVGFVAGGVLAAAGVALLLTQRTEPTKPAVALWVSPGLSGLRGRF